MCIFVKFIHKYLIHFSTIINGIIKQYVIFEMCAAGIYIYFFLSIIFVIQ